jgi:3-hydroxyisobutyrate dehydrogenase
VPAFRATHLIVFALSAKYSAAPLWRGANVDVAALLGLWLATPDAQEGHPDMARIAFLGLGNMGQAMAARLLQAGHDLTVYNRTAAKAEPLVRQGACAAATPRAAANGAEAVIAMVGDDAASRGIWLGADGALAGAAAPNAFAIECSTLSQDWVQELSRSAARRGLRYIDCPVTGLPDMAAAGELTLLVGAAPADLAAAEPLLRPLCAEMIRFGDIGAGTAYKLIVNLMGAVQIAATAEALLTAERAGLDLDRVIEALAKGQAASPQVVRNSRRMRHGDHERDITFSGRLRFKDTRYGVQLTQALGVEAPLGRAAADAFQRLVDRGLGELNESKVIDILRD